MCGARWRAAAMHDGVGDAREQRRLERVAQRGEAAHTRLALGDRQLRRAGEADGERRRSPCRVGARDPASRRATSGSSGVPRRMYSAPMPLGAPILCPEMESRSNGCWRASIVDLAERLHGIGVECHAACLRGLTRQRRDIG